MKKEYESPKVEKLEFDYSDVITASDKGNCIVHSSTISFEDGAGNRITRYIPGN